MSIYTVGLSDNSRKNEENLIYLIRDDKAFNLYEYYTILDENNDNPICKIRNSYSSNKLSDIDNQIIYKNAITLGFDTSNKIYWAEAIIEKELIKPIESCSEAEKSKELKLCKHLYKNGLDNSFILGEIRGTEYLYKELSSKNKYKNILKMFDETLVKQKCLPMLFDYKKMQENPNIGIFGNSGSGKTFALKSLIEEYLQKAIPIIIIDPHNEFEFDECLDGLDDKFKFDYKSQRIILTAGEDFGLNFLDVKNDTLLYFLEGIKDITEPQALAIDLIRKNTDTFQSFKQRIEDITEAMILVDANEELNPFFKDLYNTYGKKLASSSTLKSLSGKLQEIENKRFFNKDYEIIEDAIKSRKSVVIRGENDIVQPMMSIILWDLYHKRKSFKDKLSTEPIPPFFIAIDEAHLYVPKDIKIKAPMRLILSKISKEGRKYGVQGIFATQRVSALDENILSQISTKIILKTTQESDKMTVKRECGLNETETLKLSMLDSGNGYFVSSINPSKTPMAIKFRANYTKPKSDINIFDELQTFVLIDTKNNLEDFLISHLPIAECGTQLITLSTLYEEQFETVKTIDELKLCLDTLVNNGKINSDGMKGFRNFTEKKIE